MTAAPVLDTAAHDAAPPTTIETPSLLGVDPTTHPRPPQSLADLHLDAVVDAAAPGEFQRAAWYCPLGDPALVAQRQDVVADLQRGDLRTAAQEFVAAVDQARIAADATRKEYYRVPGDVQLLAALHRYADALAMFGARLAERPPARPDCRGWRTPSPPACAAPAIPCWPTPAVSCWASCGQRRSSWASPPTRSGPITTTGTRCGDPASPRCSRASATGGPPASRSSHRTDLESHHCPFRVTTGPPWTGSCAQQDGRRRRMRSPHRRVDTLRTR